MAAYLVILLPIVLSLIFYVKNKFHSIILWISYLMGMFLMVLSSARTSLAGLAVGLFLTICISSIFQKSISQKIWFILKHGFVTTLALTVMILTFGDNMSERITATFESYPPVNEALKLT